MKKSKWMYQDTYLCEAPQNAWGFLYRVKWDGGYYIGQKSFWSVRNMKLSKKRSTELYSGKGRKPLKEKVQKESDWRNYNTSSQYVKQLVSERGTDNFYWEILSLASSKSDLNYQETQYILCNDCLKDSQCANQWVSIKIHKSNL